MKQRLRRWGKGKAEAEAGAPSDAAPDQAGAAVAEADPPASGDEEGLPAEPQADVDADADAADQEAPDAFDHAASEVSPAGPPAAEPDLDDTGSWLVEDLVAGEAESSDPSPDDAGEWAVAGDGDEEPTGVAVAEPEDAAASPEPTEAESMDAEAQPEPTAERAEPPPDEPDPPERAPAEQLERELAKGRVELDRLNGKLDELLAEERRQRESAEKRLRDALSRLARAEKEARVDERAHRKRSEASLSALAEKVQRLEEGLGGDAEEASQNVAAELRSELGAAESRLGTRLVDEVRAHAKAVDRERESLSEALRAFEERLERLEERSARLGSDTREIQETLAAAARFRAAPAEAATDGETRDLNRITFEELRAIGLSSTQAARVLSHRDASGGYDSVERLRDVPGLPDKVLARIAPLLEV